MAASLQEENISSTNFAGEENLNSGLDYVDNLKRELTLLERRYEEEEAAVKKLYSIDQRLNSELQGINENVGALNTRFLDLNSHITLIDRANSDLKASSRFLRLQMGSLEDKLKTEQAIFATKEKENQQSLESTKEKYDDFVRQWEKVPIYHTWKAKELEVEALRMELDAEQAQVDKKRKRAKEKEEEKKKCEEIKRAALERKGLVQEAKERVRNLGQTLTELKKKNVELDERLAQKKTAEKEESTGFLSPMNISEDAVDDSGTVADMSMDITLPEEDIDRTMMPPPEAPTNVSAKSGTKIMAAHNLRQRLFSKTSPIKSSTPNLKSMLSLKGTFPQFKIDMISPIVKAPTLELSSLKDSKAVQMTSPTKATRESDVHKASPVKGESPTKLKSHSKVASEDTCPSPTLPKESPKKFVLSSEVEKSKEATKIKEVPKNGALKTMLKQNLEHNGKSPEKLKRSPPKFTFKSLPKVRCNLPPKDRTGTSLPQLNVNVLGHNSSTGEIKLTAGQGDEKTTIKSSRPRRSLIEFDHTETVPEQSENNELAVDVPSDKGDTIGSPNEEGMDSTNKDNAGKFEMDLSSGFAFSGFGQTSSTEGFAPGFGGTAGFGQTSTGGFASFFGGATDGKTGSDDSESDGDQSFSFNFGGGSLFSSGQGRKDNGSGFSLF